MTAHELVRKLLAGPDLPIVVYDRDDHLVEIDEVEQGEGQVLKWTKKGWAPAEKRYIRLV